VRRGLRPALAAVIVPLVLLAGCGSDPKAPDTAAPAGFKVFKEDKAGFAVAIPADWVEIPMSDNLSDFNEKANDLRPANPDLGNAIVLARVITQAGGKLFAADRESVSSLNLTVGKANEKSLDEVLAVIKPALAKNGATELTDEGVTLPAGPAIRLRFKQPVTTDGGTATRNEVQYYLLKDNKTYILTVISDDSALAATVAETLRIR
jgi:hypothetical protein